MRIETTNPGLYMELGLGNVCNYRCSYCPPRLNTGKEWLEYNSVLRFLNIAKPKTVLFVGGEPSIYPKIDELIKYLKENNISIHMTTNGTRDIKWWVDHVEFFDVLTLSYHLEFSNLNKFIKKLNRITDFKVVTVNVSMIHDRFDECLRAGEEISKVKNVYTSLKALNKNTELFEYTDEQLKIMSKMIRPEVLTLKEDDFNIHFYLVDGDERKKLRAQTLISDRENKYKGWLCWKGIDTIRVDVDGNIFKSICELDEKPFANIYDEKIEIPKEPEICQRKYCFCLTDLKSVRKEKV
jgi:organic radical activating enzyme